MKIGLIGCGGRGTGADVTASALHNSSIRKRATTPKTSPKAPPSPTKTFKSSHSPTYSTIVWRTAHGNFKKVGYEVPKEHQFIGFDAYQKLLAVPDINYVILATPPHFRPIHLQAAVEAGKNVFMEKPAAVDVPGVKTVMESGELAKGEDLAIVADSSAATCFGERLVATNQ